MRSSPLILAAMLAISAGGCKKSAVGESCAKTPDCADPLRCIDLVCHDVEVDRLRPLEEARAETLGTLNWIRTSEKAEHALNDRFVPVPACPEEVPKGAEPVSFILCRVTWPENVFMRLPDLVYCQYSVGLIGDQAKYATADFEARAVCDVDGDGVQAVYVATKDIEAKATTAATVF